MSESRTIIQLMESTECVEFPVEGKWNSFTPKNGKNQELLHPLFYFIKSLVILVLFYAYAKLLP